MHEDLVLDALGGVSGKWKNITHVEMELWNGDVGYGWDGTYLAFFPDGSHYINSMTGVTGLEYRCTISDRGEGYKGGGSRSQGTGVRLSCSMHCGLDSHPRGC